MIPNWNSKNAPIARLRHFKFILVHGVFFGTSAIHLALIFPADNYVITLHGL